MIHVIKATGEKELFSEEKLQTSIKRAGVPDNLRAELAAFIESKLYDGITTQEIYRYIGQFIRSSHNPFILARYSLKQAIMALGPTGYPFEDFIGLVLQTKGYKTKTRSVLPGSCISHEIDVVAEKDKEKIMVEAKFHNMPGTKTNVHVALYTKARFDDLKEKHGFTTCWLVTNTKITVDAINYGHCSEMTILSWNYPENESLRDIVEKSGLIPITALTTLAQNQKIKLMEQGIVLSKQIAQNPNSLQTLGLPDQKLQDIIDEANVAAQQN